MVEVEVVVDVVVCGHSSISSCGCSSRCQASLATIAFFSFLAQGISARRKCSARLGR